MKSQKTSDNDQKYQEIVKLLQKQNLSVYLHNSNIK